MQGRQPKYTRRMHEKNTQRDQEREKRAQNLQSY
jgi:hypothetical protein